MAMFGSARIGDNEHPVLVIRDGHGGTTVHFEDERKNFEAITEPVPYEKFLTILTTIDHWDDLADRNELYDILISRLKN